MLLLEDKVQKYVNLIEDNCSFSDCYGYEESDGTPLEDELYWKLGKYYADGKYFTCGASKGVIVDNSMKYVIKIPFYGYETQVWNEDYDGDYEYIVEDFIGTENSQNNWDYCLTEKERYDYAVECGFGEFFAETKYLTTVNDIPLYLQERAKSFDINAEKSKVSEKSEKKAKELFEKKRVINTRWIGIAIEYYGEERVEKFLEWLRENDEYTQDLHSGNLGFRIGGGPILIDFSGFDS